MSTSSMKRTGWSSQMTSWPDCTGAPPGLSSAPGCQEGASVVDAEEDPLLRVGVLLEQSQPPARVGRERPRLAQAQRFFVARDGAAARFHGAGRVGGGVLDVVLAGPGAARRPPRLIGPCQGEDDLPAQAR